jgi:hypothetical protein
MLEGRFSVERRKADKSKTVARFEESMLWDGSIITDLRENDRAVGEAERASSKGRREFGVFGPVKAATEQSASDWC